MAGDERPGGHQVPAHETKAAPGARGAEPTGQVPPRAVRAVWWGAAAVVPTVETEVFAELRRALPGVELIPQDTRDGVPTVWVHRDRVRDVLRYLKSGTERPYRTLFDLGGIDERLRADRDGRPAADFTVFYQLLSYERNADVRVKVPLFGEYPSVDSVVDLWPAADWYERELWDMFGVARGGPPAPLPHPQPPLVGGPPPAQGVALARDGARTAGNAPQQADAWQETLRFKPEEWHLPPASDEAGLMYLNVGPQHGATHGPMRVVVGLRDEEIVSCVVDIGYHHRAQEKMSERQTWHTLHPLHRPHRLPGRGPQQHGLRLGRRDPGGDRGAGARPGHPRACSASSTGWRATSCSTAPSRRTSAPSPPSSTCSATASSSSTSPRPSAAGACTPTGSASAAWPRTCPRDGTG